MLVEEQTITDANTGVTLSFRQGVSMGIVEISVEGRHSWLHFSPEGEIVSITGLTSADLCGND